MQAFYEFIQEVGVISLDAFWFPLAIWTVIAIAFLMILKSSTSLNPIYHYHFRVATIFAVPFGILLTFITQQFESSAFSSSIFDTAIFVVTNPIQIGQQITFNEVEFTPNWIEPSFIIGAITAGLSVISFGLLVQLLVNYVSIKRLSKSLNKFPLSTVFGYQNSDFKEVEIAYHKFPVVPYTFGARNPVIVLPKSIQLNHEKIHMAIEHELVHIKRGDYLIQLMISIVNSMIWFHPVIHIAQTEIETWREISCDQTVLNTTNISAKNYANMLVELVPLNRGLKFFSVNMAVQESTLKKRIQIMKQHDLYQTSLKKSLSFLGLMILGINLPIACSDLRQQEMIITEGYENVEFHLKNQIVYINGERVTDNSGGAVSAFRYKFSALLNIPEYGSFKFSPFEFEGGEKVGRLDGKNLRFKINDMNVQIESEDIIMPNQFYADLWVKYSSEFHESPSNGVAPINHSLEQYISDQKINQELYILDQRKMNSNSAPTRVIVQPDKRPVLIGDWQNVRKMVQYPPFAMENKIEGKVVAEFIVNKKGEVEDPIIIEGIGGGCDEEVLRVVSQLKFNPGELDGEAVNVQITFPFFFILDSQYSDLKPQNVSKATYSDGREFRVYFFSSNNGKIVFSITDKDDSPLEGAVVHFDDIDEAIVSGTDGLITRFGLNPGIYNISIEHASFEFPIKMSIEMD